MLILVLAMGYPLCAISVGIVEKFTTIQLTPVWPDCGSKNAYLPPHPRFLCLGRDHQSVKTGVEQLD